MNVRNSGDRTVSAIDVNDDAESRGVIESGSGEGVSDAFLALPAKVYRDDPNWPGENADEVRRAFSSANPWFLRGEARTFADSNARVAVFIQPVGAFFGYFEALGDPRAVMERAEAWAHSKGVTTLYGPINFTTYGRYRLVTDAMSEPPFHGEPYNPASYPAMLEALGYQVEQRYLTQSVSMETYGMLARMLPRDVPGIRIETMTSEIWMSRLDELHTLADVVFRENFAYTPLAAEEFKALCGKPLIERACKESSVVAFAESGEIAGFFLTFPHPKIPRAVANKTTGVRPEYRRRGLMDAMAVAMYERQKSLYDRVYAALIREDNPSRNLGRKVPCTERWYALYQKGVRS